MRRHSIVDVVFHVGLLMTLTACETSNRPQNDPLTTASISEPERTQPQTTTSVHQSTPVRHSSRVPPLAKEMVVLRKFPYPYKAMLAISSDADHETLGKFNQIHRYLNTTSPTPMGPGLGLDISDSFFVFNGSNTRGAIDYNGTPISGELSYFHGTSEKPYAASVLGCYIHSGWIDTLHTFGDFSMVNQRQTKFSRQLAKRATEVLKQNEAQLVVWTNHGNQSNVDNFGSYGARAFFHYQQGATPSSPYYHTDLLLPYGIRFVWTGQADSLFGRDSMVYPLRLPDGRKVWGFFRYTNSPIGHRGVTHWLWTVDDLAKQLTYRNLARIQRRHQYAIVATHLCADNTQPPLPANAISALKTLAYEYRRGHVLVARTSRLLQYNVTQRSLRFHVTHHDGQQIIHIDAIMDPVFGSHRPNLEELRGITFYTVHPYQTTIEIADHPIDTGRLQRNPTDGVKSSIGIRWFSPDHTNYALEVPGIR